MTTLSLKSYQQQALDALTAFARAAQLKGPALAFQELVGRSYNPDAFGEMLDKHEKVRHWVRNLVTAPCGFSLTTSRGRFFPDFVAELLDGRVAVVEYKGAHLLNDPYEIEKRQVGALWARKSQARCLFGQIALQRDGLGMAGQLDALLA
jgi:hypothetical protein